MNGNFEWALTKLKDGAQMTRPSWATKGSFVVLHKNPPMANMRPFFLIYFGGQRERSTWVPSPGDLLAEDWALYEPPPAHDPDSPIQDVDGVHP